MKKHSLLILLLVSSVILKTQAQPGALDLSFNGVGYVLTAVTTNSYANAVAIQNDGKIVVGGSTSGASFALVRYKSNGLLDSTFGTNGKVTTTIGSGGGNCNALVILSNGKILAAGTTSYLG